MLNMYLVTHRKVGYGHLKSIKPFFMCKIILFVKSHNAQWESPTVGCLDNEYGFHKDGCHDNEYGTVA